MYKEKERKSSQYTIHSVVKAISVLRIMISTNEPLTISQIANQAGIDRSVCHKILITLAEEGLISQSKPSNCYKLGIGLIQLCQLAINRIGVSQVVREILHRLMVETGETSYMFIEMGGSRVCIMKVESPQLIRHYIALGTPMPLYAGAGGKILLAAYSEEQLNDYINQQTLAALGPKSIINPDELRRELETIRINGIATSFLERSLDEASIAVPIRNARGYVIASVSVAGTAERFNDLRNADISASLKKAGADISSSFGFNPGIAESRWELGSFDSQL